MPSSVQNTTPLDSSDATPRITRRNFSDINSSAASLAIARGNYRKFTISDSKLSKFRENIFKMVSNWSYADKYNIIREYGDTSFLNSGSPSENKLNKQVTETLIINLKQEDLELMLRDIIVDGQRLKKTIQGIRHQRKKIKSMETGSFSTRTFEKLYSEIRGEKKVSNVKKYLKAYDKRHRVPRYVTTQYGGLKKEIFQVLKDLYNKVELAGLAFEMKVDFDDGSSFRDIATAIANKILLYVSLIYGKSKKGYSSAILDVKPYNDVLQYTSFASITGEPGLTPTDMSELRKNAYAAKQSQKQTFRMKRVEKTNRKQIGKVAAGGALGGVLGGVGGSILGATSLLGGALSGGLGAAALAAPIALILRLSRERRAERRLEKKKQADPNFVSKELQQLDVGTEGPYNDLTLEGYSRLKEVGREYGINSKRMSKTRLIDRVLVAREKEKRRLEKITNQMNRRKDFGLNLNNSKMEEMKSLRKRLYDDPSKEQLQSTNIPIIRLRTALTPSQDEIALIKKAVPVYVVNHSLTAPPSNNTPAPTAPPHSPSLFSRLFKLSRIKSIRTSFKSLADLSIMPAEIGGTLNSMDIFKDSPKSNDQWEAGRRKTYAKRRMDTDTTIFRGLNQDHPFIAKFAKGRNQAFDTEGTYGIRVMDMSSIMIASKMRKNGRISPFISDEVIQSGIRIVKKEPATPVYIINKDLNVTTKMDKAADELKKKALRLILDSYGMGFLAPALGLASGGTGRGPKFAKGTVSGAVGSTSQFIAGDSLNGKPNEEQISIDWNKKAFDVRPIPKMDKPSLSQSGISSITPLNAADRTKPLAVGITSHSVSYNRTLKYGNENGNKDAIKVYPVTPGLDDEIDYRGVKVSAIGLMAEMALRLSNIETLLSISNQQQVAVIESTRLTATNITKLGNTSKQAMNPFLGGGFPSSLDSILKGN